MENLGVSSVQNLQALSALLSPQQEEEEEEEEGCTDVTAGGPLGPGHIGPPARRHQDEVTTAYVKKNSKDIWSEEEVVEGCQYDNLTDPRPQPQYDLLWKQSVGTEDVFLGLNRKNSSSVCCEAVLVRIQLPDTEAADVLLDVKETFLDLRTPKYKLGLHLPDPVHSQEGTARFFREREELEVTLLLKRPMDFLNVQ
ncbi:dynein axonemal assembly factor 6 [Brachyistius frenatus]|uniref:dynein axonemal assembly factor 6 n=1 Tax=Brachyistius frenatus TaxID=100188 RepID=UPI0037E96864